jgi:ketosteroid isomerase-like protein
MTQLNFLLVALLGVSSLQAATSPRAAADELVAADRAFAAASAKTDIINGLSAMFAADVALTHAGGIAYGRDQAIDALKASPLNTGGRIEWTPARVSISGDGRHGFTAGFMTLHRADHTTTPMKYLAYWEKQREGWRVLAYKRGIGKTPAPPTPLTYVLPKRLAAGSTDAGTIERYRESLAEVERTFSNDAQKIGMRAAFTQYGDPAAINLGGPDTPTWLLGNEAIGAGVGGERPVAGSPVHWGPEKTIVAASGDFGVTIGYIVPNESPADGKAAPRLPFFTIWKRDGPSGKWLYIAE